MEMDNEHPQLVYRTDPESGLTLMEVWKIGDQDHWILKEIVDAIKQPLIDALVDRSTKAHEYEMWIARLEDRSPSHSDPIENCNSSGCRLTREALNGN